MIRADFHCHTRYSHDCFASVATVLRQAAARGLTHLAITDHDTIDGALRARDLSREVQIIVGCEVSLRGGAHLIGLFLKRKPTGQLPGDVIADIHAQGGCVLVPHPLNPVSGLLRDAAPLPAGVDFLEAVSGYEPPDRNAAAAALSCKVGAVALAGSDAHYGVDVGRACVEFPEVSGELTPVILRQAVRRLYAPVEDLSGVHAGDAKFRATTARQFRKLLPQAVRMTAKRANWLRFQRQVRAHCQEPVRKEFFS
jgi:predicted metal-dependent phosphoesterase TrpH